MENIDKDSPSHKCIIGLWLSYTLRMFVSNAVTPRWAGQESVRNAEVGEVW